MSEDYWTTNGFRWDNSNNLLPTDTLKLIKWLQFVCKLSSLWTDLNFQVFGRPALYSKWKCYNTRKRVNFDTLGVSRVYGAYDFRVTFIAHSMGEGSKLRINLTGSHEPDTCKIYCPAGFLILICTWCKILVLGCEPSWAAWCCPTWVHPWVKTYMYPVKHVTYKLKDKTIEDIGNIKTNLDTRVGEHLSGESAIFDKISKCTDCNKCSFCMTASTTAHDYTDFKFKIQALYIPKVTLYSSKDPVVPRWMLSPPISYFILAVSIT